MQYTATRFPVEAMLAGWAGFSESPRSRLNGRLRQMHILRSLFSRPNGGDEQSSEETSDMASATNSWLIVGLGNPGQKYANTRHNAGFFVVDELARRFGAPESRKRFRGELSEVRRGDRRIVLVQPHTFMNDSGVTVREAVQWYKTPLDQVLIVLDDLDLPFGDLRVRARGSAGGHNGMKSIIQLMGSQDIPRLRVGIGRGRSATISHVLSRFAPDEEADLPLVVSKAADMVELWLAKGVIEAMNVANDPANQPLAARSNALGSVATAHSGNGNRNA
jgi:PTH1 family peptidyl-tRNA hydrolase